ncbi:uncharacterized protein GIQ15_04306 [Arthroderma uncinatum]|uniref:uncharacterized protein n=1 Tax=Arthroderma uncinatum TaxID=74035 RepID=UPI00144AC707|nr:uncharacterized protein GIQ15_04306 [Arthroderma uncinatum]KAF3481547.1 hypothetical protein GIQ15_04306 [Arthroderma uncinatum]
MKFTAFAVAALLPFMALSAPAPADDAPGKYVVTRGDEAPTTQPGTIEKRSLTGIITASALLCRTCPRTSCTAVRQYSKGARVTLRCLTAKDTTTVSGNPFWVKTSDNCYVSDYYVSWSGTIPLC